MKYGLYINGRIYLKGSTSKILAMGSYYYFKKTDFSNSISRLLSGVLSSLLSHMKEGGLWEHSDFTRIYLFVDTHLQSHTLTVKNFIHTDKYRKKCTEKPIHPLPRF